YYFKERRSGIINVGGLKVHPEEIEALLNRHPAVQMSCVHSRWNPIVGSPVVADLVLRQSTDHPLPALKMDILKFYHENTAAAQGPRNPELCTCAEYFSSRQNGTRQCVM